MQKCYPFLYLLNEVIFKKSPCMCLQVLYGNGLHIYAGQQTKLLVNVKISCNKRLEYFPPRKQHESVQIIYTLISWNLLFKLLGLQSNGI